MMNKSFHVLHIITGLNDGGAEAVLFRLCSHDQSHRHTVISLMDEGKYGPLLKEAGVAVHCLGMRKGRVSLSGLFKLWRLLRAQKPGVVQTWMYHADLLGGIVARMAGIRSVVWGIRHTTLEPGKSSRATILIARLLARLSWRVPLRIAVCAKRAVEVHGALGYDVSRMRVIPNGYDLGRLVPDAASGASLRAEWGIADDMPLLGTVGRFDPQKDHANLLAALALLRERGLDFRSVLVGTGLDENNQDIVERIQADGLTANIKLLGRRDDVPAVMNALDLHVLPSAYGEAFPNVLAEAMACGTPCVTTDVGDAALIVGETGWVVPPSDPVALADAIQTSLVELATPQWSGRQHAARERIQSRFSIETMVDAYGKLWSEACAMPQERRS